MTRRFRLAAERGIVFVVERFTDALEHEPRRLLSDADVSVELHAGNALQGCEVQVYRPRPLAERDFGCFEQCAGANAEILAAVGAPVGHLHMGRLDRAFAVASWASPTVWPHLRFEPNPRAFIVREHVPELWHGDAVAVRFAGCVRCFAHT